MNQTGQRYGMGRHREKSKRAHQYGVHLNSWQIQCRLQIKQEKEESRRDQDRIILEEITLSTAHQNNR